MSYALTHGESHSGRASLRLERLLGSGRHGHAYLARREPGGSGAKDAANRTVVVKVGADAEWTKREGRALARFSHPAIVGLVQSTDTMLVLEHAEAGTMSGLLQRRRLSDGEVAGVARSIGSALRLIHRAGWIHGDVAPDNIAIRADGSVALIDFATAGPADGRPLPHHTPAYVGSDPVASSSIDCRALAVSLLELLGPAGDQALIEDLGAIVAAIDSGAGAGVDAVIAVFECVDVVPVSVGSGPPPVGRGGTADFGPRPEPPADESEPASPRRWPFTAAALILPMVAVVIVWGAGGGGPSTSQAAETGAVRSAADTLAENRAVWDESTGRLWLDGSTFPVGRAQDQAALADWDCDGRISLGVYRPSTSEWFEFDSWTAGSEAFPRRIEISGRLAVLVDTAGCAEPIGSE